MNQDREGTSPALGGRVGSKPRKSLRFVRWAAASVGLWAAPATAQSAAGGLPLESIVNRCISFVGVRAGPDPGDYRECRVSESGALGIVDGRGYHYALYCLIPADERPGVSCADSSLAAGYHRTRAVAVFSERVPGRWVDLVLERAEPEIGLSTYGAPFLVPNPAGPVLVVPITGEGTGNINLSEYYLRHSERWDRLEADTWLAAVRDRLPPGLRILKGIWPDWQTMRAEAGLYREGDANCCPTGGVARMTLSVRGGRLVLESLVLEEKRRN